MRIKRASPGGTFSPLRPSAWRIRAAAANVPSEWSKARAGAAGVDQIRSAQLLDRTQALHLPAVQHADLFGGELDIAVDGISNDHERPSLFLSAISAEHDLPSIAYTGVRSIASDYDLYLTVRILEAHADSQP